MGKYDWNYGSSKGVATKYPTNLFSDAVPYAGDNQWHDETGKVVDEPGHGILDKIGEIAPYGIMAAMGYGALSDAGLFGLGASGAAGGASAPAASAIPAGMVPGGVPSTVAAATSGLGTSAPSAAGAGMSLGKMFGKIDPTEAILGGLSLFGGDKGPQHMKPFTGFETNPEDVYTRLNSSISRLGQGLTERKPVQLRQPGPAPVQIQGLPFQIGGGLGTDPAGPNDVLDLSSIFGYDPFQSMPQQEKARGSQR